MKCLAFNGSPRKTGNTATLLGKALEGAASKGAQTTLVHLYDLAYSGCRSCMGCKTKGGKSYGHCAIKDDLSPILGSIQEADAILLGSPIYFWAVTGEMKSFMERLMYPFYRYVQEDDPLPTLFPKKIPTAFIYTMGVPERRMEDLGYRQAIALNEMFMGRIFGKAESMVSCDTCLVDDYTKIDQTRFDPAEKAARKEATFPQEGRKAFEMGVRLAAGV